MTCWLLSVAEPGRKRPHRDDHQKRSRVRNLTSPKTVGKSKRLTVEEILTPPHGFFSMENNRTLVDWVNSCDSIDDLNVVISRTQSNSIGYKAAIDRRTHLVFVAGDTSGRETLRWAKIAGWAGIIAVVIGLVQFAHELFFQEPSRKPLPVETQPELARKPASIAQPPTNATLPQVIRPTTSPQ